MKLCERVGVFRKTRITYEEYGVDYNQVPMKCKQYGVRLFWKNRTTEGVTESPHPEQEYFTTRSYWENKTEALWPVVDARRCPTTRESPKFWISDGREKCAVFVYIQNTHHYLRTDDYIFFEGHSQKGG